jgi:hypothetical protein
MSASDRYTFSPNSSSANGLTGMIRQPWRCICRGTVCAGFSGWRDAPTTAITADSARIC